MSEPVILMCARVEGELQMPDNLVGRCYECHHLVQYRPHAPQNKILRCMECAIPMIEDDDEIITTPQMILDARRYLRRYKH